MIRIVDSTLAMIDQYAPSKEQLLKFCQLMKEVGIIDLEISEKMYQTMRQLPEGYRFYLVTDASKEQEHYFGIYKHIVVHGTDENIMCQFQINDIREVMKLRMYSGSNHMRIVGLDDLICHNYTYIMQEIRGNLKGRIVNFCPENTFHCATALAIEWIMGGGMEVTTSFTGVGNRAATEEVYMGLRMNLRYKINQKLTGFSDLREVFEEMTKCQVPINKPILGSNIFMVESGIHVNGILKRSSNYSPYVAEEVGQKLKVVIGRHSGRSSITAKLKELNVPIPNDAALAEILMRVKKESMASRRGLLDERFMEIVREVARHERKEMDS